LYLARISKEPIPYGNKNDPQVFRDTLKLVDGARSSDGSPVVYFSREKL
jgi:hypothetical protein